MMMILFVKTKLTFLLRERDSPDPITARRFLRTFPLKGKEMQGFFEQQAILPMIPVRNLL